MSYSGRLSLTVVTLSIVVLACAIPGITLPDTETFNTATAQTDITGLVQEALSMTAIAINSEPASTFTPEPPTLSPTFTLSPTQTLTATPAFTATPIVPLVSVSVPTNCRVGPGKVYKRVGALLVGEVAQVYGRDPTWSYWYIRNPDSTNDFCWLWGEYASVTGNTSILPVYTPPPTPIPTPTQTPTPGFEAVYTGLDSCVGWWVEIRLQNTGSIPFKSMGLTVKDTVTDIVQVNFTNSFTNNDGCLTTNTRDRLGVGKKVVVSSPTFNYDPSGHKLQATIILCSNHDQSGTCVTRKINFKP